jgi:hypothetical protein
MDHMYLEGAFFVFLLIAGVGLIRNIINDIVFYWRNKWDFSKDSGENLFYGFSGAAGGPVSNKFRLLVGYPFFVVVFFGGLGVFGRKLLWEFR